MTKIKIIFMVVVGIIAFSIPAYSTVITFDFNYEFSEASAHEGTAPWLTATFNDYDTNGAVTLTLSGLGLTDNEFVTEWDFNLNPSMEVTSLGIAQDSGIIPASINKEEDGYKADGDGLYDIQFLFPTEGGSRFGAGDTAVFTLTSEGITANSFYFLSTPDGGHGPYLSAAHVQGIGDDDNLSGWVAPVTMVPEPTTLLLLGLGLIGLAGIRKH